MTDTMKAAGLPTSLEDLVGEHILTHTPMMDVRHPFDADASGVAFSLDDVTYLVFEDPSDGYRSNAGPLLAFKGDPYQLGGRSYEYTRIPVLASWCSKSEYGGCEIVELRDRATGALLLRVGTDNSDDCYPSFIAQWTPPLATLAGDDRAEQEGGVL